MGGGIAASDDDFLQCEHKFRNVITPLCVDPPQKIWVECAIT
jgi:hypothetical protein